MKPLSKEQLIKRGSCCALGCTNCPYTKPRKKGNTVLKVFLLSLILFSCAKENLNVKQTIYNKKVYGQTYYDSSYGTKIHKDSALIRNNNKNEYFIYLYSFNILKKIDVKDTNNKEYFFETSIFKNIKFTKK